MRVRHYQDVGLLPVGGIEEATQGLTIRRVISTVDGATDFVMDVFEIEPGGHSALHVHPWEHQVFVVAGEGSVTDGEQSVRFSDGDVIFIPADDPHQFVNDGGSTVLFVCLIPKAAVTAYYLQHAGRPRDSG